MSQRPFLALVRAMSDADLLKLLPTLTRESLLLLHWGFGYEECTCDREELPCACEYDEVCECEPDFKPCPHFKPYYFSWTVQTAIADLLWPDPEPPRQNFEGIEKTLKVDVMAARHAQGQGLFHPDDWIQNQHLLSRRLARFGCYALGNGHIVAGEDVGVVDGERPPAENAAAQLPRRAA